MNITLVMGLPGCGKSYLLDRLLPEKTLKIGYITMAGLRKLKIPPRIESIVLTTDYAISTYARKQLIKVAKELAERGYHIYIHYYPKEYRWLKAVFGTKE